MTVRTRFAPSPTGALHLGNARTALLNWLLARRHGGAYVLRFEDTDVERNVEEAEGKILESLDWLGLDRDEGPDVGGERGPYRQSERTDLYRARAEELLERDAAYRCYCRPEELEERRKTAMERGDRPTYDGRCRGLTEAAEARLRGEGRTPSVRFAADPGPVTFHDRVRGEVTIHGSEFGDFVILRSDGRPTYNFAVVVDDSLMEITHVVRGVGHLANTPKQLLVYRALDASPPQFAHIPMVLAPGREKLSKREGARSVLQYRDAGYHPESVVNYLSLLSWSSETGKEVLGRAELIAEVDLDRIRPSDAELDPEKMKWLSGVHLRREPPERRSTRLREFVPVAQYGLSDRQLRDFTEFVTDRIQLLTEAAEEAERIFPEPTLEVPAAEKAVGEGAASGVLTRVAEEWEALDVWEREAIGAGLRRAGERAGASGRGLYHPVRAALTGDVEGPPVDDLAWVLGRDDSVRRVRRAREAIAELAGGANGGG